MATLRLEGESVDGPVTWSTRANFPERTRDNPFVARLWAAQRVGWLAAEKRKRGGNTEMDAEIKSLGERYGIPTEFSSYLVVEPGMNVANRQIGAGQPLSLQQVVVTGAAGAVSDARDGARRTTSREKGGAAGGKAAAPAPASAPVRTESEARFEAAKTAAAQREAKSVAELDAVVVADATSQRRVANRLFTLVNGVWTDARYTPSMRTVTVKPYSPAYFALVQRLGELAAPFALGDRVIVAGRTAAVALAADGAERLDAAAIDSLARDW